MNTKKSKLTSVNRLPSIYIPTLINSESDYKREIRRKLDRIQHDNHDIVRRRLIHDHIFTHEHLTKRYQWFNSDKSYRDTCRTTWNKQIQGKKRTNHVILPHIYPKENTIIRNNPIHIDENENSNIVDHKITQKFLYTQPVMIEILNAPHSYQAFKYKNDVELRKKSAQRRHIQIQKTAIDDRRYTQLFHTLQET
ncbi:unnamed protein product [Adineta steineri]|uniref:Uncharacterized protein n=1 Tax=Adineta steineri TaxID=433720 RepID=A0A814ST71_9BILA|nr:unnamed protein product [Adineta steineri]